MTKTPRSEKKDVSGLRMNAYDVIHYMREMGHTFTTIARDIPMWDENDPTKTPLTGSQVKEWYEKKSACRRTKRRDLREHQ
jgi:hypothetical protein